MRLLGPRSATGRRHHLGAVTGWLLLLVLVLVMLSACVGAPTPTGTTDELTQAKLTEEVRKLRFETDRAASPLGVVLALAPFVTVLVGVITLGAALTKQVNERRDQRAEDQAAREKDRLEREERQVRERQERFDQQFLTAVAQIGAQEEGLQVAGAASLLRLQDTAAVPPQREILLYCAAQLRIGVGVRVQPILREVFVAALRQVLDPAGPTAPRALSLAGADLTGADLHGLDLRPIQLDLTDARLDRADLRASDLWMIKASGASFAGSTCTNTNFGQARLDRADFSSAVLDGARLTSAKLREADLSGARLRGAQLQSAHLEGSDLRRALFNRADVNDTYFTGAQLDGAALHSLGEADNRDRAHGLPPLIPAGGSTAGADPSAVPPEATTEPT